MKRLGAIALLLVLVGALFAGCSKKGQVGKQVTTPELRIVGHYDSQKNPADKLKVLADHTFEMNKAGAVTAGSWVIKGEQVLLSAGSFRDNLEIDGLNLVQKSDGTTWIRM